MARDNFAASLEAVLKHEGGYADHPSDPGGATNMGITRKTLADWRRIVPWTSLPKSAVKALTKGEAGQIYKARYWDAVRGDALPAGLDLAVFDFAVNSGPDRAIRMLQAIAGVAVDGAIGPISLRAIERIGATAAINELCSQRLAFLQRLSTWPVFGKGWGRRVADVRALALQLAAGKPTEQPRPVPVPKSPPDKPAPQASRGAIIFILLAAALAAAFFFVSR
ncbi:glycoside hydrolase family 108 protein [Pelagibacterium lacus]|uniref:TtsA-like Glycoside hydrolase family 108 domain-containing protein n=1 Tax=Pelagibacterium lacus TaxID=2282655 RepID=A0A369W250_9HYPH|nr:glycoside hydrolase family 108 protein [Pelagibacterium lacus]RDE08443.1 hypothetical protein DVH29_11270 [Pelagibacterium lacus]